MIKKIIIWTAAAYILVILQTSLTANLLIFGYSLNLAFIFIVFLNLFEKQKALSGIIAAFLAGLLLDIYSSWPIGFYFLILGFSAIFIKLIIRRYVRIPLTEPL